MALADNSTPGEVHLNGDIHASNNALQPELTPTGVTPGVYDFPNLVVDSKGRILTIEQYSVDDIACSTKISCGIVKIGANLSLGSKTEGSPPIFYSPVVDYPGDATVSVGSPIVKTKGIVQIGTGFSITNGILDAIVLDAATDTTEGLVIVPASGNLVVDINGNISAAISTAISPGIIQVPSIDALNIDGSGNIILDVAGLSDATALADGIVQVGTNIDVAAGVISVADASETNKGAVQIDTTDGLNIAGGILGIDIAALTTLGVIYVPVTSNGLVLDGSGNLTFVTSSIPNATTSTKGIVQVGTNIDVASGVISIPNATDTNKGIVRIDTTDGLNIAGSIVGIDIATDITTGVISVGTNLLIDGFGNLTLDIGAYDDATTSTKGIVQVGTNIDVAAGVISIPNATDTNKGIVQIDIANGLNIAGSIVGIDTATDTTTGVISVGTNLLIDGSGNLVIDINSYDDATTSTKGIVQIGTNINVASGVISISNASSSTEGVVRIDTTDGLNIAAGVLGVDIATTSLGVVQVPGGDGLSVDGLGNLTFDGLISNWANATTSTKGIVQVGTNIDVAAGIISIIEGDVGVNGIITTADSDNITISSGLIDVGNNINQLNTTNTWQSAQVNAVDNFANSNIYILTLTADFQLTNAAIPTPVLGKTYEMICHTNSFDLTFDTAYNLHGTATPGGSTVVSMICTSTAPLEYATIIQPYFV